MTDDKSCGEEQKHRAKTGRGVVATCGVFMILLGFFPKLSALAASVPLPVLGGCGIVLFGSIACTGLKILGKVDLEDKSNLIIVGVSIGMAMIVVSNPIFFSALPSSVSIVLNSAITLGGVSALLLNVLFNIVGKRHSTELERPPRYKSDGQT